MQAAMAESSSSSRLHRPPPKKKNSGGGWSSFSRTHSSAMGAPSEFTSPPEEPPAPPVSDSASHLPSFSSVLKHNLSISEQQRRTDPSSASASASSDLALIASRLKSQHPWADHHLISDVLQALQLNEEKACTYLTSISDETSTTADQGHARKEEEEEGTKDGKDLLGFCHVPVEPEWTMESDIYYSSRRDALKKSRASGKHSRGAHKAFLKGDYEKANMLSKKAMKERMEAEQLHNEAAKKIFEAQNSVNKRELWELDLHGLHANEAVDVLQHRLLYIEALLSNTMCASEQVSGSDTDGSVKVADKIDLGAKTVSEARVPSLPFGQKLNVITGVGKHSRDGGSLPGVIRTFLIQQRYKFEELRPGTLVVNPKFHFVKGQVGFEHRHHGPLT